jgi:hypothetical protein
LITNKKLTVDENNPDILIVDKESLVKYPNIIIMTGNVTPLAVTPTEKETILTMINKPTPIKV